ncbi:efflux RND transporter periplasmic adaptor subunit [Chitinophaga japonensis]|uniref:Membrane fusion protein (Multidrug efflux system) n=1 Tax=Chitinophaga japonensis TaxID=104662 RepID=A0A562T6I5_CHIJA|nr:efflux RND transporter periplasmic adaptor subunit [Chitinophaga japonensis]TWI89102.1 membrane fusion protein (multidrug efflux system) [Chitinophaga japonensis]
MQRSSSLLRSGTNQLLLYSLFIIILQACASRASEKEPAGSTAAVAAIPADGHIVKTSAFSDELEITGSLVANQEVNIVSELPRKVVRVHVQEGNIVKAGALLFQLDDADLQAQLERLRQQEQLAALNEARMKDLIEHDAAIQQDYDQAITNLRVLQAEIRQLQVTIGKTRIRAPFDGRIGIIHAYPGALVSANTVLTNIVDDSRIKVEFSVPEKYAHLITRNEEQRFTVASDTTLYRATVIAKESRMNEQTRTLLIRAITPNAQRTLVPGQSARLNLSLRTADNALKIPSQALMPSSSGYAVYLAKNRTVALTPVQIGQRGTNDVQILKGLAAGDTVITSNLLRLTPGAAVELVTVK